MNISFVNCYVSARYALNMEIKRDEKSLIFLRAPESLVSLMGDSGFSTLKFASFKVISVGNT